MIGLGRMGANMVRRLMDSGHDCVVYDMDGEAVDALVTEGAVGAESLADLASKLDVPRAIWVMVPAGDATDGTVRALAEVLESDDVIIDGGNSYYKDDIRRAKELSSLGIHYADVGTSGGVWGKERGYCLMIGADKSVAERLDPILKTLAPGRGDIERTPGRDTKGGTAEEGYLHCGPPGAGHFVKMIHNGIEYGMMQAYAEGLDILRTQGTDNVGKGVRFDFSGKEATSREINVIGCSADEAVEMVDKFLDDAFLAHLPSIRIVHGFGKGVLRKAIGDFLGLHPQVARFGTAPQNQGGGGATIATLRE